MGRTLGVYYIIIGYAKYVNASFVVVEEWRVYHALDNDEDALC